MNQNPSAYGLRFAGVENPALSDPGASNWPLITVSQEVGTFAPLTHRVGPDHAAVGEVMLIDREARRATIRVPEPLHADHLVHPMLTWIGAVFAHWLGRLGMHGGAFAGKSGAWMVLAEKSGGKSSTMAGLYSAGFPILADDMVVIDSGMVMPAPRFVDLKEDPEPIIGRPLPHIRVNERRRIILPPAGPPVPLEGAVILEWGDSVAIERVPVSMRLELIAGHRTLPETKPLLMFEMARVPTWIVRRPFRIESLTEVIEVLADLAEAEATS